MTTELTTELNTSTGDVVGKHVRALSSQFVFNNKEEGCLNRGCASDSGVFLGQWGFLISEFAASVDSGFGYVGVDGGFEISRFLRILG